MPLDDKEITRIVAELRKPSISKSRGASAETAFGVQL